MLLEAVGKPLIRAHPAVNYGGSRSLLATRPAGVPRTGGRVVEGTGLENRHTGNGIVSSNLTLSACSRSRSFQLERAATACRGGAFLLPRMGGRVV